ESSRGALSAPLEDSGRGETGWGIPVLAAAPVPRYSIDHSPPTASRPPRAGRRRIAAVVDSLMRLGLPETPARVIVALVAAVILVTFVAVSALFFIWLERKVSGRIQDRLGPTRVGGKFGWLQTVADGLKLVCKEDTIPGDADHFLFRIAPYIAFCGSFVSFLALPFGNYVVAQEMNVAVFFMLAVMSSEVFGIILAGYGSGSKWSLF